MAIVVALALSVALLGLLRARRPAARASRADEPAATEVRPSMPPTIPSTRASDAAERFTAHVRVQEEGAGVVAAAQVTVYALSAEEPPIEAKTDADGKVSVELPRAGRHALGVRADGFPEWHGYVMVPGSTEVTLEAGAELLLALNDHRAADWAGITLRVLPSGAFYRDFQAEGPEVRTGFWRPGVVRVLALLPTNAFGIRQQVTLGEVALALGRRVRYPVTAPRRERTIRVRVRGPGMQGPFLDVWEARTGDGRVLGREPTAEPQTYRLTVPAVYDVLQIENPELGRGFLRISKRKDVHLVALAGRVTLVVHAEGSPRSVTVLYRKAPTELRWPSFAEGRHYTGKGEFADDSVPSAADAWSTDLQLPAHAKLAEGAFRDNRARFDGLPAGARVGVVATDENGLKAARWVDLGEPGSTREVDVDWEGLSTLRCEFQDPDGKALAGVDADIYMLGPNGIRRRLVAALRSDAQGGMQLRGVIDGMQYRLTVSHFPRFGFVRWRVKYTAGAGNGPLVIKLKPDNVRRAQVTVRNEAGGPAAYVKIVFYLMGGLSKQVWTDPDGVAAVEVADGEQVYARLVASKGRPDVSLRLPDDLRAEFSLKPSAPVVSVTVKAPADGGEFDVLLYRGGQEIASKTVYIDGAGLVRFPQIEPGTYKLVCRRGEAQVRRTVVVAEGRDLQTQIDMRR